MPTVAAWAAEPHSSAMLAYGCGSLMIRASRFSRWARSSSTMPSKIGGAGPNAAVA